MSVVAPAGTIGPMRFHEGRHGEHDPCDLCELAGWIDHRLDQMEIRIMGATQDVIDRFTSLFGQVGDELEVLVREIEELKSQGADTTAAEAAADKVAQTLGTVRAEVGEVAVTGDNLTTATAAVTAAIPEGSTIMRIESDAQTSAYEAHVLFPDGSAHMVKMDSDFTVTGVVDGDDDPGDAQTGGDTGTGTGDTGTGTDQPPTSTPLDGDALAAASATALATVGVPEGSTVSSAASNADGTTTVLLGYPDGTTATATIAADGTVSVTQP